MTIENQSGRWSGNRQQQQQQPIIPPNYISPIGKSENITRNTFISNNKFFTINPNYERIQLKAENRCRPCSFVFCTYIWTTCVPRSIIFNLLYTILMLSLSRLLGYFVFTNQKEMFINIYKLQQANVTTASIMFEDT